MKLTTVNLPEGLLERVDRMVKEGHYPTRAHAIRAAIRRLIDEEEILVGG